MKIVIQKSFSIRLKWHPQWEQLPDSYSAQYNKEMNTLEYLQYHVPSIRLLKEQKSITCPVSLSVFFCLIRKIPDLPRRVGLLVAHCSLLHSWDCSQMDVEIGQDKLMALEYVKYLASPSLSSRIYVHETFDGFCTSLINYRSWQSKTMHVVIWSLQLFPKNADRFRR